ncbi:hypothetical protein T265_11157 [Opisthorchis viverrini]|uniref:Uncharacterized protein n=1 Tax=Opisthorchis viverrini TaxID=6198 RepID=A0A074Z419_OPIVI|nr:hypothetical protein T265_11157 [Opisthorchis viverrini]KER20252.1 hypothetical protein T265_11157 [Opisthorchis viverrini]
MTACPVFVRRPIVVVFRIDIADSSVYIFTRPLRWSPYIEPTYGGVFFLALGTECPKLLVFKFQGSSVDTADRTFEFVH